MTINEVIYILLIIQYIVSDNYNYYDIDNKQEILPFEKLLGKK